MDEPATGQSHEPGLSILPFSLYAGATLLPLSWSIFMVRDVSAPTRLALILTAILVGLALLHPVVTFRPVSERFQAVLCRSRLIRFGVLAALAVSPVGDWMASAWLWLPPVLRIAVPVASLVWLFLNSAMLVYVSRVMHRRWWQLLSLPLIPLLVVAAVVDAGVLGFFLVVQRPEAAGLIPSAFTVVGVSVLLAVVGRVLTADVTLRTLDGGYLVAADNRTAARELGIWLAGVRRHPEHPDLSLVYVLLNRHHGGKLTGSLRQRPSFASLRTDLRSGQRALQRALVAIEMVEQSAGALAGTREFAHAKGLAQHFQAAFLDEQQRYDEALTHYRAAARTFSSGGMPNYAARAEAFGLGLEAAAFGSTEPRVSFARIAGDKSLSPLVRRHSHACLILLAQRQDGLSRDQVQDRLDLVRAEVPLSAANHEIRDEIPRNRLARLHNIGFEAGLRDSVRDLEDAALTGVVPIEGETSVFRRRDTQPDLLILEADEAADRGDWRLSESLATEAARVALDRDQLPWFVNACIRLAHANLEQDRWDHAYRNLEAAMDVEEIVRERTVSHDRRIEVRGEVGGVHELALLVALRARERGIAFGGSAATALEIVERSRSRALLDVMGESVLPDRILAKDLTSPEQRQLAEQETVALEAMRDARQAWIVADDPDTENAALADMTRAEAHLTLIRERLAATGPEGERYLRVRRGRPLSYQDIRLLLDPALPAPGLRVVLVEYYVVDDSVLIFRVDPRAEVPEIDELEVDPGRLARAARALLTSLAPDRAAGPAAMTDIETRLADPMLVDIMRPVLRWAPPGAVVYLVPHGILHRVPLHAIAVDGVSLADRNAVVYIPSASVLRYCQANRRPGPRADALVVTDPVGPRPITFGSAHEDALRRGFDFTALRGEAASRASLLERLGPGSTAVPPAILHVTAHGVVEPQESMKSGLQLSDGRLTATDILDMRLRGSLVTLAACGSGISEARSGDELLGLIRALLHAGAPAVLVSLWDVDELSTAMLLDEFYRQLSGGAPAVQALTGAVGWLRRRTAQQVGDYAAAVRRAGGPATARVALAEARIRWSAGDHAGVAEATRAVLSAGATPAEQTAATRLRQQARFAATGSGRPDLNRRVYDHPFFWAPFVLVGDWI